MGLTNAMEPTIKAMEQGIRVREATEKEISIRPNGWPITPTLKKARRLNRTEDIRQNDSNEHLFIIFLIIS
jgi:hypothetical protein